MAPRYRKYSMLLRMLLLSAVSTGTLAQSPAQSPASMPNPTVAPSAPPPASPPMTAPGGFVIYPKNGQNLEQQSADRFECHSWAKAETGFDPTASAAGDSSSRQSGLESYRRAMTACLDAKGYSVHVSAPAVPAAPPPPSSPPPRLAAQPVAMYEPSPELKYHPFRFQIDGGYNATAGAANQDLEGGAIAGLGFAWFPTAALPIGLRVDGNYSWFRAKDDLLAQYGAYWGHEDLYGGDADLQLDLAHRSSRYKLYLLGGVGWYRENTRLRGVSWENGTVCFWFHCGPGSFPVTTSVLSTTSPWLKSWNAGLGWEMAVADRTSFFIEARYERIRPYDSRMAFVPVTLGFRF